MAPDFAGIYGSNEFVTPRMAYRLWTSAVFCTDTWRLVRDDPRSVVDELPPVARPWATGAWFDRFVECFRAIAGRLAVGDVGDEVLTTCTGEEMALHLIIDLAEAEFESGFDSSDGEIGRLPDGGMRDSNFYLMRDVLLRDDDVLMLFDPALDGIDDPESEPALGYRTVNLHPNRWFLPFGIS